MPPPSGQGLGIEGSVLPEGRSLSFWGRETSGVKHLGWFTFKAHLRKTVPMTPYRTHLERLALSILDAKGIAAIWQLYLEPLTPIGPAIRQQQEPSWS